MSDTNGYVRWPWLVLLIVGLIGSLLGLAGWMLEAHAEAGHQDTVTTDELDKQFGYLSKHVERLEQKVDRLDEKLDTINARIQ